MISEQSNDQYPRALTELINTEDKQPHTVINVKPKSRYVTLTTHNT